MDPAPPQPHEVNRDVDEAPALADIDQPSPVIPGKARLDEAVGKAVGGTVIASDIRPSDMPSSTKLDTEKTQVPVEEQPQERAQPKTTQQEKEANGPKDTPTQKDAASDAETKNPLKDEPKQKTVGAYPVMTRIGWLEAYKRTDGPQNEFRDKSIWMEEFASSALFGAFWHNAAAVIAIPVVCFVIFKLGGGFVSLVLIIAFGATYYKNSIRRFRRNARDDITRELIKNALEDETESTEWINNFMSKFWLIYEPILCSTVVGVVDGILVDQTPSFLESIRLTTFTLGTKAPRVESIKSYPKSESDIVLMDWRVSFTPTDTEDMTPRQLRTQINPKIVLTIRVGGSLIGAGMPILVEDMSFSGHIRLKMKLTANFPHIKTLDFCFLEPPVIDYVLKPVGGDTFGMDIAHIPGLQSFIRDQTHAILGPMMYAPNVYTLDLEQMMTGGASLTAAAGIVQFTIYNAKDLKNTELVGNSDPYVSIRLGNRPELAATAVQNDTLNPVWNETNIILINNLNEVVCMELFDKDTVRKDRPLGQAVFDLKSLEEDPIQDEVWCKVLRNGKERGAVRIRAAYFPVQKPEPAVEGGEPIPVESNSGILAISLAQAKDLVRSGKTKTFCQVYLNGKMVHTTKKAIGANPAWWADVDVFITDLQAAQVSIEVISDDRVIGNYGAPATRLIKDTTDKVDWLSLQGGEGTGKVKMSGIWKPILMGDDLNPSIHKPAFGVLRVQVLAGRELRNVEIGSSSDPYVVIKGDKGVSRGCTKTIENNLNPVWNEIHYVPVTSIKQSLEFETFDYQKVTKDRTLGKTVFNVSDVIEELPDKAGYVARPAVDKWAPLAQKDGANKGELHYRIEFYPTLTIAKEATEKERSAAVPTVTVGDNELTPQPAPQAVLTTFPPGTISARDVLEYDSGVLVTHLIRADLDRSATYCEFYVDSDSYQFKSQVQKSRSPKWNEVADIFVKELEYAKLVIMVKEKSSMEKDPVIGIFSSNIRTLLETTPSDGQDFVLLDKADKRGTIHLKFEFLPVPIELLPKERLDNMGNLTVNLVRAKNLIAADRGGASDPYVVFKVNGKEVYKSEVVKKTVDPEFSENFVVPIASRAEDLFSFEVFDWNQLKTAKSLGVGALDLKNLQVVLPNEFLIPLQNKHNQGEVQLKVKFMPEFLSSNKRRSGFGATFIGGGVDMVASGGHMLGEAGKLGVGTIVGGLGTVGAGAGAVGQGAIGATGAVGKGAMKGVGAVGKGVFGGLSAGASAIGFNKKADAPQAPAQEAPVVANAPAPASAVPPAAAQAVAPGVATAAVATPTPSASTQAIADSHDTTRSRSGSVQTTRSMTAADGSLVGEPGNLTIHVMEADGLLGVDKSGTSDPYVKVKVNGQNVLKTKTKKETLTPNWSESVVVPGLMGQSVILSFSIKDHNTIGSDKDLADIDVPLWDYIQPGAGQKRVDFWAQLGGSGGRLRLVLEFEPTGEQNGDGRPDSKRSLFGRK
ncbi:hypothetical protein KVV02_001819 [Mortierella alpina]|uniref:Tricalbin n=1 Tax=Mortierella alpina TaxID=64518 RepID=A0A9P8A1W2_MORAP|nr:hypothetical protein KVV02_001819 [Mortierella alpina]